MSNPHKDNYPHQTASIVLASASAARSSLLEGAGLRFLKIPAEVDEDTVKESFRKAGKSPQDLAVALADQKAHKIGIGHPEAYVIGADQTLDCEGRWFDKPSDKSSLLGHLNALSGRTHHLHAAVSVYHGGQKLWGTVEAASMTMRALSHEEHSFYADAAGSDVLGSVGGYRLEGLGAQLFERIEGDYFTILGLPLLSLLAFFRSVGVIQTR